MESGLLAYRDFIDSAERSIPESEKWIIDKHRATQAELEESVECLRAHGTLAAELAA